MGKQNKGGLEDILPRNTKVQNLIKSDKIPESTAQCVIVRPNNYGLGFKFDCYHPQFLKNRVEQQYFDKTVQHATKICGIAHRKKKLEEESDPFESHKRLLISLLVLMAISLILFSVRVYGSQSEGKDGIFYAAVFFIVIVGILVICVFISTFFIKPLYTNLEEEVMKNLQEYLENENQIYYSQRGLTWKVAEHFYYLELYIGKN